MSPSNIHVRRTLSRQHTWRLTIQKTPFIPGTVTVSSVLDFWEEYYRDHSFQDGEMKETTKENCYHVAKRIRGYMGRKKVEDLKL